MKIVFFGSSDFSLSALEACLKPPRQVVLVITTPDAKQGRGLQVEPTPVRIFCEKKRLSVEAPPNLKDPALLKRVQDLNPDLFVVSSYGKMIPSAWLKIPRRASLNVHPSLLPKYRGAAPLRWPIIHGDRETGVSIAEVTDKLDAGDIYDQMVYPLNDEIDSAELTKALSELSFKAIDHVMDQIQSGRSSKKPQDESASSYAAKLKKSDGLIDWRKPAHEISNLIRGLLPWPTAYTVIEDNSLQILKAKPDPADTAAEPGEMTQIESASGKIRVQTGKGSLWIERVRPAGKKAMSAADFANGRRLQKGFRF